MKCQDAQGGLAALDGMELQCCQWCPISALSALSLGAGDPLLSFGVSPHACINNSWSRTYTMNSHKTHSSQAPALKILPS